MKKVIGILAVVAMLITANASAGVALDLQAGDVVQANLSGGYVVPRVGGIEMTLNGTTYGNSTSNVNVGGEAVWAGCYLFDIYDNGPQIANDYQSFCLDLTADPVINPPSDHDVTDTIPADMESMWGTYYDTAITGSVTAAAFQLAVWEMMHEDIGTNGYDLGSGNLFVSQLFSGTFNNGATLSGLISQANDYLTGWTDTANLLEVQKDGYQPFVVEVPEPATLVLLGLGGLLIRKRK